MTELSDTPTQDIVARAGRYYRNARYVICAMALGAGLWFGYDGFYNWPKELEKFEKLTPKEQAATHRPHSETDINLQRILALFLVPLSPLLLGFFLYRSRGQYRLSGTTLYVPGHPPVSVEAMMGLDMARWKRKGIAYLDYKIEGSEDEARLTLDDFVYDQTPTDRIVAQLEKWIGPEEEEEATDSAEEEEEVNEDEGGAPEDAETREE